MKTIQELQQETEREFFEKFGANKIWVTPSKENVETIFDIHSLLLSSQQSAYDLGCEVTMERVRKELLQLRLEAQRGESWVNDGLKMQERIQQIIDFTSPTPESDLIDNKYTMREIKFRAWDGERMKEVVTWGFSEGFIMTPKGSAPLEDYNVMQFTGLLDKNGKEIYEGDVITHNMYTKESGKYEASKPKVVFWDSEKSGFETNKKGSYSAGMFYNDYEIIGNIYENPELLSN